MFRRKCASLCSYYSYYYSTFPNACPRGKWGWMYYLSFLFHGSRILYCPLHSVCTLICPGGAQTLAVGFRLFSTITAHYFFKITFKKISIFKTFESIRIVRTLNRDSYMNRFFLPPLVSSNFAQPLKRSDQHSTGDNQQPDQLYAKEMANGGHTRYWLVFRPVPPPPPRTPQYSKTAHFRVAFYCGQPKAHLCNNHAV